jgi:hypothetical protein
MKGKTRKNLLLILRSDNVDTASGLLGFADSR